MNIIGMFDGGTEIIKHRGQPIELGVIRFRMQNNEQTPFEVKGYYNKFFRKNVLNGLRHIHFLQEEKKPSVDSNPANIPDNNGHVDG
jgi:hypothetical protein